MSVIVQHYGLSKLDWFAGQALAGFTVSQLTFRMLSEDNEIAEEIAGLCYQLAEAMMTIREVAHGE
jgi:hypothetical protein